MDPLIIAAVGDVLVDRAEPAEVFGDIGPLLRAADLTFGNFEGVLTDTGVAIPGASSAAIVPTANALPLSAFDVMSLANNHSMDAGYPGLAETVAALSERDVRTVGAGASLAAALAPHVVERGGRRIAVLAATSVFQIGVEARAGTPGVAPLRAEDSYLPPFPGVHCPGVPARVLSVLDEGDWERLAEAVSAAREDADAVVVSVHWGDHTRPWVVTEHERLCGELLVEAGADIVLGHHQHIMRGMEFVAGKPVWYGLGHIVFDFPRFADELRSRSVEIDELSETELAERFGEFGIYPRAGSPNFPFHPLARMTGVAVVELAADSVGRCGMVPCVIDGTGVPRPVTRTSDRWSEALDFFENCAGRAHLASGVRDSGWVHHGYDVLEWTAE